jgi:hypothetical protein
MYSSDATQRIVTQSLYRIAPPFSILNGPHLHVCTEDLAIILIVVDAQRKLPGLQCRNFNLGSSGKHESIPTSIAMLHPPLIYNTLGNCPRDPFIANKNLNIYLISPPTPSLLFLVSIGKLAKFETVSCNISPSYYCIS